MLTFKELLAELKCNEQDLQTILQHGLIRPVSIDNGIAMYGSNTIELLREDFDALLKKCEDIDKEIEQRAVSENKDLFREINESREERDDHDERSEDEKIYTKKMEEENASTDETVIEDNNEELSIEEDEEKETDEKKQKKKKKTKNKESSYQATSYDHQPDTAGMSMETNSTEYANTYHIEIPEDVSSSVHQTDTAGVSIKIDSAEYTNAYHIDVPEDISYSVHQTDTAGISGNIDENVHVDFLHNGTPEHNPSDYSPDTAGVYTSVEQTNVYHIDTSQQNYHEYQQNTAGISNENPVVIPISIDGTNDEYRFRMSNEAQQNDYIIEQYIKEQEKSERYNHFSESVKTGETVFFKEAKTDDGIYIDAQDQYQKEIIHRGHETSVLLDANSVFSETHSQDSYNHYYYNSETTAENNYLKQKVSQLYRPHTYVVGNSYGMQRNITINLINSLNGEGTSKIGNGASFIKDLYQNSYKNFSQPENTTINQDVKTSVAVINKLYEDTASDNVIKVYNEPVITAEQEQEYQAKQQEKQLIVATVVSKRMGTDEKTAPAVSYQKVIVHSTKSMHYNSSNLVYSDRRIKFNPNCKYRIISDKKLLNSKARVYMTQNAHTLQTLHQVKRQYLSQFTRKVNYKVNYVDLKLKKNKKMTQPIAQTSGRFFIENTNVNQTDVAQGAKLIKKYLTPFGYAMGGLATEASMSAVLSDMNNKFDFNVFSKMLKGQRTSKVFFEGHGFNKKNIDGFHSLGCSYFKSKYAVNFSALSKGGKKDFLKHLKGNDAELWKALMMSNKIKQSSAIQKQFSQSLRVMLFHTAMKAVQGTDVYDGGMLLYRGATIARTSLRTVHCAVSIFAKPTAQKVLSVSRKSMIDATNSNKNVVDFFDKVAQKQSTHVAKKQQKAVEKVQKKSRVIKKRLDRKAKRKANVKKYFSNTKAGKQFKKIMGTKGGQKVGKLVSKGTNVTKKIAITTGKAAGSIFGFLSRFKTYVYLIFGVIFLVYILYTFISAGLSQLVLGFYNTLPTLGKEIFNKVAQIYAGDDSDSSELSNREQAAKDTIDLIKHVYDKNTEWYDNLSENEKKTPAEVNGGTVYGGTNPQTKKSATITTWGCPGNEGIFYECYNGNAIAITGTDPKEKPYFVEGMPQSLYDKTANTKAIFCMTYIHYNGVLTDNKKKMTELEDTLFDRSHVVDNKVSDLYQCDGCKTLKNYKCIDDTLSNKNCKGPVVDGTTMNYNFLKSDSKGKINNHSGKGCTAYSCTDSKKGENSWKTEAGQGYGCKKKEGYKETTTYQSDKFKNLDSAYYNVPSGQSYLTLNQIANITASLNQKNEEDSSENEDTEKVTYDDPTTYIPDSIFSPKANKTEVVKGSKTYRLKDGYVLGCKFSRNGTCKIYFLYTAYYCNGKHYGCPGKHSKVYCSGHVDLTIRFATAGIGEDEYDENKLTELDPYKEAGSYEKIKHVDDNSNKPMWEGWDAEININWLYTIYNQDWNELGDWSSIGMGDMNGSVEAGSSGDYGGDDFDYDFDDIYDINGGDGKAAAEFAKSKLGYPYSQPLRNDGKHFDCSSLVFYAYKSTGLSIMYKGSNVAASQAQWAVAGKRAIYVKGSSNKGNLSKWQKNNWSALQPGDCIYYNFGSTNRRFMNISHAAIYYGNGILIDASSSKGKVVMRKIYSPDCIQVISRPTSSTSISGSKKDGVEMRHANYTTISYMKVTSVTSKTSSQYKLLRNKNAKTNSTNGIRMYKCVNGSDGKTTNGYVWRYCVAMGTYYGTTGAKFDVYFKGNKTPIRVIMGDVKSDAHTDPTHMYHAQDHSTIECIVGDISKANNSKWVSKYNAARSAGNKTNPITFPANNQIEHIIYRGMETSWNK